MKMLLIGAASVMVATWVAAGTQPFNLSLTPEVAIYDRGETIEGFTLSVWGENQQTSLALGIANGCVGNSAGLSWGLLLNYAEDYRGVQWSLINYNKGTFRGWQDAFLNYNVGQMEGLQTGLVNYARHLTGVQFGVVNYAEAAEKALQIGLANIIRQNTQWFSGLPHEVAPAMVLVNWRF